MKARHLILGAGLLIAAWLAFFGDKTPNGGVAEPVTPSRKVAQPPSAAAVTPTAAKVEQPTAATTDSSTENTANNSKRKEKHAPTILALRSREELIGGASTSGKDATLFGTQSWVPPPPPPPKPAPPPPPTAPDLPFTYIGKKLEDGVWEVYLTQGEHTIIVHEKSAIEQTYRVEAIKPPTMTLTYLPLNQMQTLTIGGEE